MCCNHRHSGNPRIRRYLPSERASTRRTLSIVSVRIIARRSAAFLMFREKVDDVARVSLS